MMKDLEMILKTLVTIMADVLRVVVAAETEVLFQLVSDSLFMEWCAKQQSMPVEALMDVEMFVMKMETTTRVKQLRKLASETPEPPQLRLCRTTSTSTWTARALHAWRCLDLHWNLPFWCPRAVRHVTKTSCLPLRCCAECPGAEDVDAVICRCSPIG
jgi:hypothetical protein